MISTPARLDEVRRKISWREVELASPSLRETILLCVEEDLHPASAEFPWICDLTTSSCQIEGVGDASLVAREPLLACGLKLVPHLLEAFGCINTRFDAFVSDGSMLKKGESMGKLSGAIQEILAVERTILNFLQRLSGVASRTAEFVRVLAPYGVGLLDTRKTTPCLRWLEKYATACGGSFNHRIGLYDRILIKDNHLAAAAVRNNGDLREFLSTVVRSAKQRFIEVEIDRLDQLEVALSAGVDAVLLDNFSPKDVTQAVGIVGSRAIVEASGGIDLENLDLYAEASPHFISTGSPVHGARWMDVSLDWSIR